MKRAHSDVERFEASSSKRRRLLREEELILEITELMSSALEDKGVSKSALAAKMGKSKGFVSQILSGRRNLTLRTLADIADALEFRIRVHAENLFDLTRDEPKMVANTKTAGTNVFHWPDNTLLLRVNRKYSAVPPDSVRAETMDERNQLAA